MRDPLPDPERLHHILDAPAEIESYIQGNSFEIFFNNSMMRYAVIKQLEIIGEAANNLSEKLQLENNHIEWSKIASLRNLLVHEYFGVDSMLIWQIVTLDLPVLKSEVIRLLDAPDLH